MRFLLEKALNLLMTLAPLVSLGCLLTFFMLPNTSPLPCSNLFSLYLGEGEGILDQYEADLSHYKTQVYIEREGSLEREQAQKELDDEILHRKRVECTFVEIGKSYFGDHEGHKKLMEVRRPLVDDWNCFKDLANTYQTHCGQISTYHFKYTMAFANICNDNSFFEPSQFADIAARVCGKCNSSQIVHF
ncbi:vacuolar-processing enzyme-like [Spinacia oleracea]|uniref:Vacuolar-processing enzyme-like n=1 Tax=Spinacia oleracea TaxID=3562 RepID=A0ABM3R1B2_SPIOL|nr:vacuolar-processing enzyme-like [Spinacia oleracea]